MTLQEPVMRRFDARSTAADVLAGADLRGRLAVVTGAGGGIGAATARALAGAGADVVIGGRSAEKIDAARRDIARASPDVGVTGAALDLMSIHSIDAFADTVLAMERPIDILVNNAGIIGPLVRNAAGMESGLMTNFIGHAVLTSRLAEKLVAAGSARIISLSSFGHHFCPVDLDDLNFERREYSVWASYGQSKTACSLLAVHVAARLGVGGVDAFAVHPGAIVTELGRDLQQRDLLVASAHNLLPKREEYKSIEQGAATSVWAATEPLLAGKGPLYLEDCGVAPLIENAGCTFGVMPWALDPDVAAQLWSATERLIGRRLPLPYPRI